MKEEILAHKIVLKYLMGSLNPIDINEQYLKETGLIDEKNKLNRGMLRIGSLGTNLIFSNETSDEIRVNPTSLKVESTSIERLVQVMEAFKNRFGFVSLQEAEFTLDIHLIDELFPEKVFTKYSGNTDFGLEGILFKHGDFEITMYSCGPNIVHIRVTTEKLLGKQFDDFNLNEDLNIDSLNAVYELFKQQKIDNE